LTKNEDKEAKAKVPTLNIWKTSKAAIARYMVISK